MLPFDRHGPMAPASPVVISVPHAGRDYPATLLAEARVPAALVLLEDRHVDAVALAAHGGEALLIQRTPRASIDLNRAEDERDPQVDAGARAGHHPSAKVRSGLGLVPRRAGGAGELWRRRFSDAEVRERIASAHRPYHAALAAALDAAEARFGVAVLVDLHSMPPLPGARAAEIVIGDRYGRTAGAGLVSRAAAIWSAAGFRVALNAPYAGGHLIERHAAPARGRHALQLEIDRRLYLDAGRDRPGPGLPRIAELVRAMLDALCDEVLAGSLPAAAE
jgi:N-formylglutamate amidohydrolase